MNTIKTTVTYTAPGVTIEVEKGTDTHNAAAFIGAVACIIEDLRLVRDGFLIDTFGGLE